MNAVVTPLPIRSNVEATFERYKALALLAQSDPALLVSFDHNIALVEAWADFRDAYLAWTGR